MHTKDQSKEGEKEAEATSWPTWEPAIYGYLEFLVHEKHVIMGQNSNSKNNPTNRDGNGSGSRRIMIGYKMRMEFVLSGCTHMKRVDVSGLIISRIHNTTFHGGHSKVRVPQKDCFVMWQMVPNIWLIELAVGGHKVVAGCDGNVAWRHTPWLGSHAAQGGVLPLRRALQINVS
nr:dephospho-CoA kinase [Tanacetum cinerariifolium]